MKKLKSSGTLDRLSELPDSLILTILSSLEMEDVVRTTFLSKRWNDLWTTIPCLCFVYYDISHYDQKQIRNFINQALLLWKGSRIQNFELCFSGDIRKSLRRDMNRWLRFVMEKKVEELYLHLPCDDRTIPLPHFLFECSSIRKLSIVGSCSLHIRGDVQLDQLKSLTINLSSVSEDVINRVISGARQLVTFKLSICDSNQSVSIRSSSLKKLSIEKGESYGSAVLTIWTPNLETLKISGAAFSECLLIDVSSLTDVTLDFDHHPSCRIETLRQILPTFKHVEKLTLSSWIFKVPAVVKAEFSFSPLSNVKLLRLTELDLITLNEIVCILEILSKLNMLDLVCWTFMHTGEPLNYEVNTIKSVMMQLRIVSICCWKPYEKSIFEVIEFFLKHATMLEKIVIQKRGGENVKESDDMILASEKLVSLQRSFPAVDLKILSSSSDDDDDDIICLT